MMEGFNQALREYKEKNGLYATDIGRMVGITGNRIGVIISGDPCSDATKKKISDALGGIFEGYVNYNVCVMCGKNYIPEQKNSKTCSTACASAKNRESNKKNKNETIADRLKAYREEHQINQIELAALIGVARPTITKVERGEYCSDWLAKKIYDALGVRFKKFLRPKICSCGKAFHGRKAGALYCSTECHKKYYKTTAEQKRAYNARKEDMKHYRKPLAKPKAKPVPIAEFMGGKQYGDRQREYLLNLQKTQRMAIR